MLGSFAGLVHGVTLIESGHPDRGIERMTARAGGADLPLLGGSWRAYFLDWLARGLLAAERPADAERAAAAAAEVAETTGLRTAEAWAARASARVAPLPDRALASVEAAGTVAAPIEAGLSRIVAGRALAHAGDADRAADELSRAAAAFDEIGAVRYRAEAERELARLGVHRRHRRTRAATAQGLEALTERELEVARLIVDRRTNPQIAAELFLSTKTVESHVRNLFHKLGVSSRADVARAVERAERR